MLKVSDEKKIDRFTAFLAYSILYYCAYCIMADSAYNVKSTPPRVFSVSFLNFAVMLYTY